MFEPGSSGQIEVPRLSTAEEQMGLPRTLLIAAAEEALIESLGTKYNERNTRGRRFPNSDAGERLFAAGIDEVILSFLPMPQRVSIEGLRGTVSRDSKSFRFNCHPRSPVRPERKAPCLPRGGNWYSARRVTTVRTPNSAASTCSARRLARGSSSWDLAEKRRVPKGLKPCAPDGSLRGSDPGHPHVSLAEGCRGPPDREEDCLGNAPWLAFAMA